MLIRHRRLAGLRFSDGNSVFDAEGEKVILGLGIKHAAAAYDERPPRCRKQLRRLFDLARIGRLPAEAMDAWFEKRFGIVIRLGLHVLAKGERHGSAFRGISQ